MLVAVTGITGQVGSKVANNLIEAGHQVRSVVRDAAKGEPWTARGCELAIADIGDARALRSAFAGADGVFVLLPPSFDPSPGFPEVRRIVSVLREALDAARPGKVVCLSTIGAHVKQTNLLTQLQIMEQVLGALPLPVAFLRPAWFMENSAWDIEPARSSGVISGFLQPSSKSFPMVATADVGSVGAELLVQQWEGRRVVELEGPRRVSPDDIAVCLGRLLGRDVRTQPVPRESWETLFRSQGMKNPTPRMHMLDGFNAGWIEFEAGEAGSRKGRAPLETVMRALVERVTG